MRTTWQIEDAERAAFEEWAKPHGWVGRRLPSGKYEYGDPTLQYGWISWQASAKRRRPLRGVRTGFKCHELKTDPQVFDDVASGLKSFEIRKDDRGYEVGDMLSLRKTRHSGQEMANGCPLEYVGAPLYAVVTYIMRGPIYGLAEGWVIMGIETLVAADLAPRGSVCDKCGLAT